VQEVGVTYFEIRSDIDLEEIKNTDIYQGNEIRDMNHIHPKYTSNYTNEVGCQGTNVSEDLTAFVFTSP